MDIRSLYFHFPFCETKCHYCDFYSLAADRTTPEDRAGFSDALRVECELRASELRFLKSCTTIDSIFFGGGTPSMTNPEVMAYALEPLELSSRLTPDYEWTMEANPSSVNLERLKSYRKLGVNRISMGVQSLDDSVLKKMGRAHGREQALKSLETLFSAGFTNVSVDLLCGIPGQTLDDLNNAMKTLCSFPITHLSCYLLTLTPTHRMFPELPDENTQLEHLLAIDRFMNENGFEHYEVSNFAKKTAQDESPSKYRAQHNMNTWLGKSYLGFGPSAHSFDQSSRKRWKNISSLKKYIHELVTNHHLPIEQEELLSDDSLDLERWMLTLRLKEGFPKSWIDSPRREKLTAEFLKNQWIESHPTHTENYRLSAKGFPLLDSIVQELAKP